MKKLSTQSTTLDEKQSKSAFFKCFLLMVFVFGFQNSFAQTNTWDGSSSNSWSTDANWSLNHQPTATEDVVIPNVTTDPRYNASSSTVKSITIQNGGNLVFERSTAFALTVTGNVTVNTGGTFGIRAGGTAVTNTLNIGGNFVNDGTVDFTDTCVINANFNGSATQTISGSGATMSLNALTLTTASSFVINRAIDVASNWTNNGKTVSGTGTVTLSGTATIGGTTSTAFPNLTITGTITQGINTSVSGNFNKTGGTYNISSSATSYTLAVTGNFSHSGGTFNVSNGANSSALTVGGTFGLSGGTFVLENTTTATGGSVTVTGLTTISGTGIIIMDDAGSANTCSFNAVDFTASGTGGTSNDANRTNCSLDFGIGSTVNHCQFKISGNFVHSSTNVFYTSSLTQVGSIIFNKAGTQTLSYSGTNSQYTSMTVNAGSTLQLLTNLTFGTSSGLPASTVLVNGTLDAQTFIVAGASTGSEIFNLASGGTLITANTNGVVSGTVGTISTSMTRTFNAAANYIFDGAANQTANFGNTTLNNLTISNTAGSVTLNAVITANSVTINSGGGSLTAGSFTHLVSGNWTNNGGTFVPGAGTISLNGTSQTIGGTLSSINFNNLSLSGGTKTFSKVVAVSGNLSIASGAIADLGSLTTHTSGTLTLGGLGTAAAKFGSTNTSATPTVYKTDTYFTSGSTGYITVSSGTCTTAITVASITSNNATTSLAKNGDVITVSFTTSGTPSVTPTVTINSSAATVTGSGTSWSATKTVSGDANGLATFSISVQNAFGCTASRTTVTNSSSVTVDTSAPTIPTIAIASNNANTAFARTGNIITLSFTTSETPSATPVVTINGASATVSGSGTSYTATKTVAGGDTNGVAPFSISIRDAVGNTTLGTATTNGTSVTVDTSAPTIPTASIASNNTNPSFAKSGDSITLSFTTSETPATTPTVTISGGAASVSGSGTSYTATRIVLVGDANGIAPFSISIADAAGNTASRTATTNSSSVTVDTVVPTFSSVVIASNNANPAVAGTGDTITLSFSTSEVLSATPVVTINGSSALVSGSGTSWTASISVSNCSGNSVAFLINVIDLAGNTGTRNTTSDGSQVTINPTPSATIIANGGTICEGSNATFTVNGSNGATLNYSITGQVGVQQILLSGVNQSIIASNATSNITLTLISVVNANCSSSSFATSTSTVTVNPSPIVTAADVSGCSGSAITLSGSASPTGGSGSYSVANPYIGTSSTTYTYTYTAPNGCPATSAPANIIITPQPLWFLDADGDQYYTGAAVPSCTSPGAEYFTAGLLGGGDCNDNDVAINPGVTDICYNNIDENCNGIFSDGCAPVVVNMTASYDDDEDPIASLSTAIPAVAYTYPGATNLKYRFSIKNVTTNTTAPDIIQASRYVTIPASIHLYNAKYTIKVSAVINDEVVPFAGNTITILSPTVQLIKLSSASCGTTLGALSSAISANAGLNATSYTFRIRLNDSNPSPIYAYSQSATRFVSANSFTGFPLQYSTSYKISAQYTSTDPITNLPVESGYGAECTVNTPSIPLTSLASPICGSQVAAMNANISAGSAPYAIAYQFRIRLVSDSGPSPTYYFSAPNASRFSSLTAFQGITFAYSTEYLISVQYSILNGASTIWSGYGSECKIKTPFFPVTSLIPTQCGLSTPTSLTQQLNISPYPGFPHYKVKLDEISGEDVVNSEEREISYSFFKLSDFAIAQPGKNYNVSVAIKLNGVFGDYDTACDLFTEAPSKTITQENFKATAYPNPFANNFMLDIKTSNQSSINIRVYDMVGRLVEQRDVASSDLGNTSIGASYPSGIYNVIISQEENVQTIRVIKR